MTPEQCVPAASIQDDVLFQELFQDLTPVHAAKLVENEDTPMGPCVYTYVPGMHALQGF
jgi:hypothetical protein